MRNVKSPHDRTENMNVTVNKIAIFLRILNEVEH